MKQIEGDIRRYAFTQGHAFWHMIMPTPALLEDARGAHAGGQLGLLRHTARNLGSVCAVTLAYVERDGRPAPALQARPAWALRLIEGHPLAEDCERLIRGDRTLSLPGMVVIETKTGSALSSVDRLLWRRHCRPCRMSKYGTGLAALRPHLPATHWRRTLRRGFARAVHTAGHRLYVPDAVA